MKGNMILKITGVLMLMAGVFGMIGGITAASGVSGLELLSSDGEGAGMFYAASVFCLVSGGIQVIAGIKGLKNSAKPEMARNCLSWGAVAALLCAFGTMLDIADGSRAGVTDLASGFLIPAVHMYGVYLNLREV